MVAVACDGERTVAMEELLRVADAIWRPDGIVAEVGTGMVRRALVVGDAQAQSSLSRTASAAETSTKPTPDDKLLAGAVPGAVEVGGISTRGANASADRRRSTGHVSLSSSGISEGWPGVFEGSEADQSPASSPAFITISGFATREAALGLPPRTTATSSSNSAADISLALVVAGPSSIADEEVVGSATWSDGWAVSVATGAGSDESASNCVLSPSSCNSVKGVAVDIPDKGSRGHSKPQS